MKKRISLVMALVLIVSMFSAMTASAAIYPATANYSKSETLINGYAIQNFSINGHSVVNVDDLDNYGFSVQWDPFARAVYVSRALAMNNNAAFWNPVDARVRDYDVYGDMVAFTAEPSDIRVFIDAEEIPCYVSHNNTFINFRDLAKATVLPNPTWGYPGSNVAYHWDPVAVRSTITINDLPLISATVAPDAWLTYEQACTRINEWLASSVYAKYAYIEYDFNMVLAQARPTVAPGTDYTFNLQFDFDAPDGTIVPGATVGVTDLEIPVQVLQDGTVVANLIPAWVTFFCTNF